jgi:hypothetical protein
MKLEFADEELALLEEELRARLGTLREEIYHSDVFEFTKGLKHKESLIKGMIEKVESARKERVLVESTRRK